MLRLAKYLKPFTGLLVIAIALLFVQAVSDLSLPNYLSKIVNVGIQQGGVEDAIPKAIRQSEMNRLTLFVSADDKTELLKQFTLVDKNSPEYSQDVKVYPTLANEPIYVLNNIDQAEIDKLNPIMGKAWLAVSSIEQVMADPSKAATLGQSFSGFDLSKLPKGTDLFAALALLPAQTRASILDTINQKFGALGDSMITQSAVGAVKTEYTALGMDTAGLQTSTIINIGILMLLISLLSGVCTVAVGYFSARIAAGVARDLRRYVFRKVESFSNTEIDKFSTSSLITRSTNDITQIQTTLMILIRMACYAPIMGVGGVIMALRTSASMSWIIALAVIVLIGFIAIIFSISLPKFAIIQKLLDRLNLVTGENLSGMMVIRAFNTQVFEEKRFDKANQDVTATNLYVNRVMASMLPVMMLIMNGVTLLIIWIGSHQVAQSTMQVGDMIAFMQYALQIVFAFLFVSFMFIIVPRAQVSATRIADVLETEPSIQDPKNPKPFQTQSEGTVEFRHVAFRYPGAEEDVLHDISFTAMPGQTTAFIGSTGSGKSTLVNLIPRFYDVTAGSILVDGTDIRDVTQSDLRDEIGYIPQKANLFSGTIESNLRYADENASDDMLKLAIDTAQASKFIAEKPEGIGRVISQGGTNVSGGQRQRLSIARALVKQPPIYIFDDSFSALDFKTDVALRHALKERTGSSTLLIVAQRISTIKTAEQIIVLDEGKIVGTGTHNELMDSCETYREIALSQLSVEELA
jgi:ATP-binding cassette, subfamily B, multidrug efflux pump